MSADNRPPAPPYRRRNFWIDPGSQGRYILHLVLVSALIGAGAAALTAWTLQAAPPEPGAPLDAALRRRLLLLGGELLVLVLLVAPLSGLLLSHRMAGPVYRFRKSLERLAAGETGFRVHLRRYDRFKDTAAVLNGLIDSLERRRFAERALRGEVAGRIEQALGRLERGDENELPEALRLLEEAREGLREDQSARRIESLLDEGELPPAPGPAGPA